MTTKKHKLMMTDSEIGALRSALDFHIEVNEDMINEAKALKCRLDDLVEKPNNVTSISSKSKQ